MAEHTVRGQHEGYLTCEGVLPSSQTATFACLRLFVDNWRWQGVPFYLRSGKAMAKKTTKTERAADAANAEIVDTFVELEERRGRGGRGGAATAELRM